MDLSHTPVGVRVRVHSIDGDDPTIRRRLVDLGFVPGAVVHVLRRAPLRDPVLYRVAGAELCLRRDQAERVGVEPTE